MTRVPERLRAGSGVRVRARAVAGAVERHIRLPIGQENENGRIALARDLLRKLLRETHAGGKRRSAAARQAGERFAHAGERTRRRQQNLCAAPAKGDERGFVAPHITFGEQMLHGALGLGEPVQRSGA